MEAAPLLLQTHITRVRSLFPGGATGELSTGLQDGQRFVGSDMGIPINNVSVARVGGNTSLELRGTKVRTKVAIHLAMWFSSKFANSSHFGSAEEILKEMSMFIGFPMDILGFKTTTGPRISGD